MDRADGCDHDSLLHPIAYVHCVGEIDEGENGEVFAKALERCQFR